ncbi:hypothetical protein [Hansschlegelia sp.]|uniref:hypothetical protein n=1 Tax=Hansschlegelia sp. TaxID=2041892 RepID=UPI002C58BCF3|nr:hypothetical protein [Hansschlegelia sp.]HVI28423.1 hypothetical protein [Hansschlegelia sp.]
MSVQTKTQGEHGQQVNHVEAKQGTDAPKGMPLVVIVGVVAATAAMAIIWLVFFAR